MNRRLRKFFRSSFTPVVLLTLLPRAALCADVGENTLSGEWKVAGKESDARIIFYKGGDFAHTWKAKGSPVVSRRSGAYATASDVCSSGSNKGNLWVAVESDRCCFRAYFLGTALILDHVGNEILFPEGLGLCQSKTLAR